MHSKGIKKKTILVIFLLTILTNSLSQLLPFEEEGVFDSLSPLLPTPVNSKLSSEEESIDSWDVHPESLRWNTTLDDAIEDRVIDSQFEILAVQNETSGRSGYEMNRGTVKTDGKFEWRMKSDGGGNQTEYFLHQIGDESDFTEGDNEGWTGMVGQSITNGILTGNMEVDDDTRLSITVLPKVSTTVYHTLKFKIKANVDDLVGHFRPSGRFSDNFFLTTSWQEIILLREDSSAWNDNDVLLTNLIILFDEDGGDGIPEATDQIEIDFIKLFGDYDFATHTESEIEDTWDWEVDNDTEDWTALVNMNVSEGLLRGDLAAGASDNLVIGGALTIDTDVFFLVKIKMNTSDTTLTANILVNIAGVGNVFVSTAQNIDSTTLTEYVFDLSLNSNWDGIAITVQINLDEQDGTLDGDEQVFFEYILLLGEFNPSDSVIGLMDAQGTPLLNISTHFFGNNTQRMEAELLDATGELSYHWYSDLFGDLGGQFLLGRVTFDVLRSRLEVTISTENNTRIDKVTFPQEFTVDSGLTPVLFSNEIPPKIFISTHTIDHSWQSLFIDWIKTDFKEREWFQSAFPATSGNWIADTYRGIHIVNDTPVESSSWLLSVINLDSVSAVLSANTTDNFALHPIFWDFLVAEFFIYGIDGDDGDAHVLVQIAVKFAFFGGGGGGTTEGTYFVEVGGVEVLRHSVTYINPLSGNPKVSFSVSTSQNRENLTLSARGWTDADDESAFFDVIASVNIRDEVDDLSQEFLLETKYTVFFRNTNGTEGFMVMDDFGLVTNNIFSDIAKAVVEPLGNFFQQIFVNLFKFLAGIFKSVGDVLGVAIALIGTVISAAILTMQNAVTGAIGLVKIAVDAVSTAILTMQGVLATAIGLVETAIGTLQTALETAIGLVETAIGTLQTALETAIGLVETAIATLEAALETAIGLVETAVEAVTSAVGELIVEIQGLAEDVADAVWTGIGDALDFITDAVEALAAGIWVAILAVGEDLADLVIEILDFVFALAGDILDAFWVFVTEAIFFLWDLIGLPDIFAIFDALLVGFGQFITGIPQFITDVAAFGVAIGSLLVTIGFIWIFILPVLFASSAGECIEKIIDHAVLDLTAGASVLGIRIPLPVVLPWAGLLVFTFLTDTVFFGFF